jgi:hypothetical protein
MVPEIDIKKSIGDINQFCIFNKLMSQLHQKE